MLNMAQASEISTISALLEMPLHVVPDLFVPLRLVQRHGLGPGDRRFLAFIKKRT